MDADTTLLHRVRQHLYLRVCELRKAQAELRFISQHHSIAAKLGIRRHDVVAFVGADTRAFMFGINIVARWRGKDFSNVCSGKNTEPMR
jgi:hypothetical protein